MAGTGKICEMMTKWMQAQGHAGSIAWPDFEHVTSVPQKPGFLLDKVAVDIQSSVACLEELN